VRHGQPSEPDLPRGGVAHPIEREPARGRDHERVGGQEEGGLEAQALRAHPEVVPDRHGNAERAERHQRHDCREPGRAVEEVGDPLRRADGDGRESEPVPAAPDQHDRGRCEGDEDDCHAAGVVAGAGQEGGGECAQDAERAYPARLPANRKGGRDRAHEHGQHGAGKGRQHLVDLCRDGDRHEQASHARGDRGERRVGPRTALMEPDPEAEQAGGADRRDHRARALPDPAVRDRDGEEEGDPENDGEAADPREHPTAQQVLERVIGRQAEPLAQRSRPCGGRKWGRERLRKPRDRRFALRRLIARHGALE
jgi:hypothetical protein